MIQLRQKAFPASGTGTRISPTRNLTIRFAMRTRLYEHEHTRRAHKHGKTRSLNRTENHGNFSFVVYLRSRFFLECLLCLVWKLLQFLLWRSCWNNVPIQICAIKLSHWHQKYTGKYCLALVSASIEFSCIFASAGIMYYRILDPRSIVQERVERRGVSRLKAEGLCWGASVSVVQLATARRVSCAATRACKHVICSCGAGL